MLQRIQTIHLLLVLGISILLIFVPIGVFSGFEISFLFNSLGLHSQTGISNYPLNTIPLVSLLCFISILSALTIFIFKNRNLQIKLCVANILLQLSFVGLVYWYIKHIEDLFKVVRFSLTMKSWALFLPIFSIILLIMAIRAIKKDDNLIKSADRLR